MVRLRRAWPHRSLKIAVSEKLGARGPRYRPGRPETYSLTQASLKYTERKNDRPTETAAPDTQNVGRKVWKSLEFELGAHLV